MLPTTHTLVYDSSSEVIYEVIYRVYLKDKFLFKYFVWFMKNKKTQSIFKAGPALRYIFCEFCFLGKRPYVNL
jgi:hypothetical protein